MLCPFLSRIRGDTQEEGGRNPRKYPLQLRQPIVKLKTQVEEKEFMIFKEVEMSKQVFRMLCVISVLALVLSGCAAKKTSTPTTAAAAPQTQATTAPQPAAAGKWCSGVNITFFPGGPAGGVFAVNVYNGAVQAEADLGPKVNY